MKIKIIGLISVFLVLSGIIIWNGCGKSSSSTSLVISGTLDVAASGRSIRGPILTEEGNLYQIYCVTFLVPPSAGYGDVDADNKFSLTLENAANVAFGCFILNAGTLDVLATVYFEDDSSSTMTDKSQKEGSYIAANGGNLEFGTVKVDLTKGTAVVEKGNITGSATGSEVTGDFFSEEEINGTWNLKCIEKKKLITIVMMILIKCIFTN